MRTVVAPLLVAGSGTLAGAQATRVFQPPSGLDLFGDTVRTLASEGSPHMACPFSVGVVPFRDAVLMEMKPQPYSTIDRSSTEMTYNPDIYFTSATSLNTNAPAYLSQIAWNFGANSFQLGSRTVPANSIALYSQDYIPAVETVVPQGTFTFDSAATPIGGASTLGIFQFQTRTAGKWTTQFSLNLTGAQSDTRSLSFPWTTRVRWLLIRSGGAPAEAAISCRYQQTA